MASSPGVRLPLHRRVVRVALRSLRPLAVPFLSRLQWRLNFAVDRLDPKLQQLLDRESAATARIEMLSGRVEQLSGGIEQLSSVLTAVLQKLETALIRNERLQIGLDAVRADQVVHADRMAALLAGSASLSEGTAAVGARVEEMKHSLSAGTAAVGARVDEMKHSLSAGTAAVGVRVDEMWRSSNELATAIYKVGASNTEEIRGLLQLQRDGFGLSEMALARADLLLQRVAIPMARGVLMRTPEGFLMVPEGDPALAMTLWDGGGWLEPGTIKVIVGLLAEGDHVIDVGANVGLTVLPEARRVGVRGRVIAIEPASAVSTLLQQTVAINGLSDRVVVHQCAAGETAGKATLNLGFTSGHSSLLTLPGATEGEEVEIKPLDALVEPGQRLSLVKIDAEGFELMVLRGMRRVLADNSELSLVVEFGPEHLHRAGVAVEDWLEEFLQPGFTGYEIDEQTGVLRPLRSASDLASVLSVNILMLRRPPSAFPDLTFE